MDFNIFSNEYKNDKIIEKIISKNFSLIKESFKNSLRDNKISKCIVVKIYIEFLEVCNICPVFMNNIILNFKVCKNEIKKGVLEVILNLLKEKNIKLGKIIDLKDLITICLIPTNVPFGLLDEKTENFYKLAKYRTLIENKIIEAQNKQHKEKIIIKKVFLQRLIIFRANIIRIKQEPILISKLYSCENDFCKDRNYYLCVKNNIFITNHNENFIKLTKSFVEENCCSCKSLIKENYVERFTKTIYYYRLNGSRSNFMGYSDLEIENGELYLLGYIKRKNLGTPYFKIISYFHRAELKINNISLKSYKCNENNLLFITNNIFCKIKESCQMSEVILLIILNIFKFKNIKIIINTNDDLYIKRLAEHFFALKHIKAHIIFNIEKSNEIKEVLIIGNFTIKDLKKINTKESYLFHLNFENKELKYDYYSCKERNEELHDNLFNVNITEEHIMCIHNLAIDTKKRFRYINIPSMQLFEIFKDLSLSIANILNNLIVSYDEINLLKMLFIDKLFKPAKNKNYRNRFQLN